MNHLLAEFANLCLDCLQEEIKALNHSLMEQYLLQDDRPSDCDKCEKKLDEQAQDVPKPE